MPVRYNPRKDNLIEMLIVIPRSGLVEAQVSQATLLGSLQRPTGDYERAFEQGIERKAQCTINPFPAPAASRRGSNPTRSETIFLFHLAKATRIARRDA